MGLHTVLLWLKKAWKNHFYAPELNVAVNVSPQVKCLHRGRLSLWADKYPSFLEHYLKEEFANWWPAIIFCLARVCLKFFWISG